MKFTKTSIAAIMASTIGSPLNVSASTITFDFTGVFTLVTGTNTINTNSDAAGSTDAQGNNYLLGSRTPYSGMGSFDTVTGAGSATINAFSFFGGGFFTTSAVSFQAIGDGMGSTAGNLLALTLNYNWSGAFNVPITAILDAAGFFSSIDNQGAFSSVQSGCFSCATSATPDTPFGAQVGDVPIAMTTYNTAGTTLGSIFPLTTDGIVGSPSTTAPIAGGNFAFDFTTLQSSTVPQVPVPAAVWLFGSGLIGLACTARRRRKS